MTLCAPLHWYNVFHDCSYQTPTTLYTSHLAACVGLIIIHPLYRIHSCMQYNGLIIMDPLYQHPWNKTVSIYMDLNFTVQQQLRGEIPGMVVKSARVCAMSYILLYSFAALHSPMLFPSLPFSDPLEECPAVLSSVIRAAHPSPVTDEATNTVPGDDVNTDAVPDPVAEEGDIPTAASEPGECEHVKQSPHEDEQDAVAVLTMLTLPHYIYYI